MVKFLHKDNAYAEIVEIVSKADNKLVLISPYIKIPGDLLERLKYKDGKGIKTIVVCREKDLNGGGRSDLKQLKHLDLRFDDDLHAKCFYNEKSMVITSLNLLESSERKNREMGVLLSSEEDSNVFNEALNEAKFIIANAKKDNTMRSFANRILKEVKSAIDLPPEDTSRRVKTSSRTKQKGFCIKCGKSITYDLDAPYCPDCYRVWKKFKNPDYKAEFCHLCGTPNELTTMNRPLCNLCFKKPFRK